MTEYDYSPGAYERYLAKQREIARWVDDTVRYPPANPFLPSDRGGHAVQAQDFPPSPPRRNSTSDSDSDNPPPQHHRQRQHRDHYGHRHHRPHRSHHVRAEHGHGSTSQRSRSSSLPSSTTSPYGGLPINGHPYPTGYDQQHPYRTTPAHNPYNPGSSHHTLMSSSPAYYPNANNATYTRPSSGQPLIVPIQGGAGGYVVVPPKGTSYQVLNQPQYQPPTSQPWYKRVFSPTPSGKSSKTSSSGNKKQSGKWSWDRY